ncbi:MAG: chaperonin GroEL [Planctomycetota bacterium]|nr:MAG: chaperonin GroEL [Planctomycetota bacterium]
MPKHLTFDSEAREAVLRGVEKLSRAVVSTLGPKGRSAVLDKSWGGPLITKDGASVAQEIELRDRTENLGALLVREAASKTADRAGDGTTTATLLAASTYKEALRHITVGADPAALQRGLRKAMDEVKAQLAQNSKKVRGIEDLKAVATVASNNDPEIGEILAKAYQEVGPEGVITIEEGRTAETEVKPTQGMQFDRGFLSPHFATDLDTLECVLENPYILIYEDKISSAQKLLPLLEKVKEGGRPLLIIAEEVEGEALATLVVNKLRGIIGVCAVKAPGYGDRRKEMLRDIATVVAAEPIMKESGVDLEKVALSQLGRAKKVLVDSNNTTVIQGAGKKSDVEARAGLIRRQVQETTSDYDREKLEERLARLVGGIAQILVGGATETEVKEKKARFEDAKSAARAAHEEGILPGGGVALLRISQELARRLELPGDEALGAQILERALSQPLKMIAENAGHDGAVVARRVLGEKKFSYGFNALSAEYGDLYAMGVVDPAKVTRTALENAVSVASTLISTDCLVTELPKKKERKGAAPGGDEDFEDEF